MTDNFYSFYRMGKESLLKTKNFKVFHELLSMFTINKSRARGMEGHNIASPTS